jgi:hypothetical protein
LFFAKLFAFKQPFGCKIALLEPEDKGTKFFLKRREVFISFVATTVVVVIMTYFE